MFIITGFIADIVLFPDSSLVDFKRPMTEDLSSNLFDSAEYQRILLTFYPIITYFIGYSIFMFVSIVLSSWHKMAIKLI